MSLNKKIKSDSLLALKNNWLKTIGITSVWLLILLMSFIIEIFIYMLIDINSFETTEIFNNIIFGNTTIILTSHALLTFVITSIIVSLIYCSIFSVLTMGDVFWSYLTICNKDNDFFNIFYYFSTLKNIFKSWYISISIFIRKIIWAIIIFLPSIVVGGWSIFATIYQPQNYNKVLISFGYILSCCLIIVSTIICLIFFQRYFLTRYLIISGECQKLRQAIKLSIKIMNGKKTDCLILILSFLGWFISCIFIIPIFFVFPYIKISLALYSRYLIEEYNYNKNSNIDNVMNQLDVVNDVDVK